MIVGPTEKSEKEGWRKSPILKVEIMIGGCRRGYRKKARRERPES